MICHFLTSLFYLAKCISDLFKLFFSDFVSIQKQNFHSKNIRCNICYKDVRFLFRYLFFFNLKLLAYESNFLRAHFLRIE